MPTNDEYWKERSERRILEAEKTADELLKDMKTLYLDTIDRINKEIEAFYGRYSTETGLSIEDVKKLLDKDELSKFRTEAQKYYDDIVKHAYDPTYRQRLKNELYQTTTKEGRKLYSLRRNVSRLDYLKMQIENALEVLYMKENEAFTSKLSSTYEDTYMRSVFDTQQATAVFQPFNSLNNSIIEKAVQQKWLGENYSDRIWSDKNKLLDTLNKTFLQDVAIGKNPKAIASDIKKATGVKYSNCERLARTEFNNIANQATYDSYESTEGLDKYKYVATLDARTSTICQNLSGKVFLVKEAEQGVNYPPMHPNCYAENTEVFTSKGWKKIQDCQIFDKCLSINLENEELSFQPVIRTFNHQENEIYEITYNNSKLLITGNHKIVIETELIGIYKRGLVTLETFLNVDKSFWNKYYFILGNNDRIPLSDVIIKKVPYFEYVYCIQILRNNTLLVRYNSGNPIWCGNCRSTTIPYLEDLDYSKMEQIATLGGKSYFVPSDMSYKDWVNSLTEKEGKMYIAERKATQQYKSDVKQLNDYRKLVTQAKKQGNAELFEGFPTKIKDFQQLKYTQPEKWEIYKNNAKIVRND